MRHSGNKSAYRRGITLGLTMAEIVILIIFLLLLGFAALLKKEKDQNSAIKNNDENVMAIIRVFSENSADMNADIVRLTQEISPLMQKISEGEEKHDEASLASDVIIKAVKRELALQQSGAENKSIEDQLAEALEKQADLEREKATLRDQKKSLIAQIEGKGRGVDWPPCWPDSEGRASEFIFKTALTSRGIIISNTAPSHRVEDMKNLPLNNVKYGQVLSVHQFQADVEPLFKWSKDNECRFYVLVHDETGATEKALFKRLLSTVEGSFYKKIVSTKAAVSDVKIESPVTEDIIKESQEADTDSFWGMFKTNDKSTDEYN